jgi:tRNA uracil 4-sulfurtransferase
MDNQYILLRYGELFLKGRNQRFFEKKLIENIKALLGIKDVLRLRGRLIVPFFEEHQKLKHVFGISSYSIATKCGKNVAEIQQNAVNMLNETQGSFRIETKRSDKTFPVKSPELNIQVGRHVEEQSNAKFEFKDPDITLHIEINQDAVYLFTQKVVCHGGLPTGVEGKVTLLVENEASLLAGLLFMKRGCSVYPIASEEKDISLLQKYSPTKVELKISGIEEYADQLVVVGDSFDTLIFRDTDITIFKPLIAYSGQEIIEELAHFA